MSAALPLSSFSENASRLGMRIQESFNEALTRDFGSSTAALFDGAEDKLSDIRRQLDSSSDKEKMDALRRLIAMISKGRDVSEFFAQVVKNVASSNMEVRKLVYIYILRYAESEPDLALLSINTFQKDLTDSSPLIRAMALRVLSGIRVNMIGSIMALAIKKCATDVSPYVRKTAALAIPKCLSLDDSLRRELMAILTTFLNERSPLAIGTVLVAFNAVCPDRLDLLHPHYRRLCRLLPDADEWGQVTLVNLLVRYARRMLSKPHVVEESAGSTVESTDPDLRLLLTGAEPLFMSRNPSVIVAVARAFYYVGPPSERTRIVSPLLRLLHTSFEVERVAVEELYLLARDHPDLLSSHYSRFYLRSSDPTSTKLAKLRILVKIMKSANASAILSEFDNYVHDCDDAVAAAATNAIGSCARLLPEHTSRCISMLIQLMKDPQDAVGSSAVRVLKDLVQISASPSTTGIAEGIVSVQKPTEIVESLARQLDDVRHPRAKACVFWLVGQYAEDTSGNVGSPVPGMASWAPDVLRRALKTFADDEKLVKLQTMTLAAKLILLAPESDIIGKLGLYCFNLARYDQDYDVRDRGRLLFTLLSDICPLLREGMPTGADSKDSEEQGYQGQGVITLRREQIRMILLQGKEPSKEETDPIDPTMTIGSMALVTGKFMSEPWILPDWAEEGTESSLRDSPEDRAAAPLAAYAVPTERRTMQGFGNTRAGPSFNPVKADTLASVQSQNPGAKWKDIDDFYAEDSNAKASKTEEEESGEESSEEEEDEDEEEEGEDDDDDDDDEEEEMSCFVVFTPRMEPPPPRLPSRLQGYTAAIQKLSLKTGASVPSLAVSLAILHEVTALVPLVGVYWGARTFGIGDRMTTYFSSQNSHQPGVQNGQETESSESISTTGGIFNDTLRKWTKEGEARVARVGVRYGILGFTKGQKLTEDDLKQLGGRVASEVANGAFAYMVVKALLPVRIGASLYLAPAFSKRFLQPITSSMTKLFKRQ
ncbi:hypothetical protein M408DRAFT_24439 [Serendipita vermifera MAFF 305830]|uniref:Clathrin/coatomer adaptor adaptin-like N-terminal domain-containing protein n=1 Tax=Serendipita vermifera MAFF 305830 TaxID=933852 RepID=A0A0C3B5N2_SERVB|nr:hypothetical protein M408DRAFT_24439 [Serendipita vermifera MAFF 305830]